MGLRQALPRVVERPLLITVLYVHRYSTVPSRSRSSAGVQVAWEEVDFTVKTKYPLTNAHQEEGRRITSFGPLAFDI